MDGKYDYMEDLKQLEEIVAKVEDPSTAIDSIDEYMKSSEKIIARCRKYLRSAREKVETFD